MDSAAAPSAWGSDVEGGEWELRHDDDGFTYKILKRPRLDEISVPEPPAVDPEAEEKRRRSRKQKVLLKLKGRYQEEIDRWERLSNSLREMEERVRQETESRKVQQFEGMNLGSPAVEGMEDSCASLVDELLAKADAEERLILSFSNLCDQAEAACDARQERFVESFLELPVWSSPRELMASLCDD
ncbi:unnamed protein product [Linum trigynum]|uniref:Uncharacterized protein n=1 Tax=Linum trigynum TaxID=586398 RepID=A0AAV2F090_9ROSI